MTSTSSGVGRAAVVTTVDRRRDLGCFVVDCAEQDEPSGEAEMERLFRNAVVARVIGVDHSGPTVDYVRYVLDDDNRMYFYAQGRSLLARTSVDTSIVIEIDDVGARSGRGASIVVHGVARPVNGEVPKPVLRLLPEPQFRGSPSCRLVEVTPTSLRWRRVQ